MRALPYVSLAVWLFAGAQVYAQFESKGHFSEFRGQLTEGSSLAYDNYYVEITSLIDRTTSQRVDVLSDGAFLCRSLPDGDYSLRVSTLYGAEVATAIVSVGPSSTGSTFEIPLAKSNRQRPVSGTISIQQLNHPLSKHMRKLLDSGQKLLDDKHYTEAAERFREAVQLDPQCAQAHAQLALALGKVENWDGAILEYRAATAMDPANAILHSNLSATLASANRFEEAENEASAALKLDPRNPRAHYVMAGALLQMHGSLQEVVTNLAAARDYFPSAQKALDQICASKSVSGCP